MRKKLEAKFDDYPLKVRNITEKTHTNREFILYLL